MWARASLFRRLTDTVPLKYGKLATNHPWIYGFFLQCVRTNRENSRVLQDLLATGLHEFNEVSKQHVAIAFTKPVRVVRHLPTTQQAHWSSTNLAFWLPKTNKAYLLIIY